MKNNNYYDAFIDSILSLPPKIRNAVIRTAGAAASDNNPYLYLWTCYNDLDNPTGVYIAELFDQYKLAID